MDYEKKQEIPFGVFDSELMEATYFIPQGYHAVIEGDKVIIKKGEEPVSNDLEEFAKRESELFGEREYEIDFIDRNALTKGYYWGVKAGAQWQKEQMIDKACEWLKNWNAYRVCLEGHKEWFIEQFRKAMEK